MKRRKARGRPPKGTPAGKTKAFSARVTPELRAELDASAATNGRTLSDEVQDRLLRSFHFDQERKKLFDAFGGRQNYAACRLIADLMRNLSAATGKSWADDAWTFDQFGKGVASLLSNIRPAGEAERPTLRHYPDAKADDLGETAAAHIFLALELTTPGAPSSPAPRHWLDSYPILADDLGSIGERIRS